MSKSVWGDAAFFQEMRAVFSARRPELCVEICGQKTRPHGGDLSHFLCAVPSARRPVLCLKICGLKTLLDRGELSRFFVFVFCIVLRALTDKDNTVVKK